MHTYSVLLKKAKINYGFKKSYPLSSMLQLANHSNIAYNKETLQLLHPLDGFEHCGLLK